LPSTAAQVVQNSNLLNGIVSPYGDDVTTGMTTKPGTMLDTGLMTLQ
jgi:hypothetical protein